MSKVQGLKPAHKIYKRLIRDHECVPGGNFVIGYEDVGVFENFVIFFFYL